MSELSVVIVSHNRRDNVEKSVDQLARKQNDFGYELFVIDNASTDGTVEVLKHVSKQFPQLNVFFSDENLGLGKGRNLGLRAASGRFVVCLDDDCEVTPEALSMVPDAFMQMPDAGIITFRVRNATSGLWENDHGETQCVVANFHGAAHAFRREVLAQVGFVDELCTYGGEELDLSIRAHHAGFATMYVPTIEAEHDSHPRRGKAEKRCRTLKLYHYVRVLNKHFPPAMADRIGFRLTLCTIFSGLMHGPVIIPSLLITAARGRAAGRCMHYPVCPKTAAFYDDPDLRPEYGNVPLARKVRERFERLFGGR